MVFRVRFVAADSGVSSTSNNNTISEEILKETFIWLPSNLTICYELYGSALLQQSSTVFAFPSWTAADP